MKLDVKTVSDLEELLSHEGTVTLTLFNGKKVTGYIGDVNAAVPDDTWTSDLVAIEFFSEGCREVYSLDEIFGWEPVDDSLSYILLDEGELAFPSCVTHSIDSKEAFIEKFGKNRIEPSDDPKRIRKSGNVLYLPSYQGDDTAKER